MYSLILRTAAKLIVPLLVLFSIFILFRGHDEPGGGFIGGLIAGSAFALYAAAYGTDEARAALRVNPLELMSVGLAIAFLAGLLPLVLGQPVLTGLWVEFTIFGADFKTGSPIVFDIGIFLLVVGTALTIVFELDADGKRFFPHDTDAPNSTAGAGSSA